MHAPLGPRLSPVQITDVLSRRLVSITGPEGIGKTAVGTAVAHYLALRQRFSGGVYFVHLKVLCMLALSQLMPSPVIACIASENDSPTALRSVPAARMDLSLCIGLGVP